jgi:hypothetical protein
MRALFVTIRVKLSLILKSDLALYLIISFIYSYNPFIYCWLNKTFRNGAKKFLLCFIYSCHQSESLNRSISNRDNNSATLENITNNINLMELQQIQENTNETNVNIVSVNI